MYAYVDRPASEIEPVSRLVLWAMRRWVALTGQRRCPATTIGAAFAGRNMIAALHPLLRMMALLNRGGLENFAFCRVACNHVSEHEAILLQLVDDAQAGRVMTLRGTIAMLVEDEFAGDLFEAVVALGGSMRDAFGVFPTEP